MTRRDPRQAATPSGASATGDARERERASAATLEELKAQANASVYAERTRAAARVTRSKERIDVGTQSLPVAPGAVRPTGETKAAAPRKKRHGSSELERVRRHGTGEHIRARRHGTGEYGRVRGGAGTDTAGRLGPVERAELTPNTAVVLSRLRHELAEKRDQAFGMALERGDDGSADQYLQGRTQGLSEALKLLEKLIAAR